MRCINKLRFDQSYSVPMTKRFETKFKKMKLSPKSTAQPLSQPISPSYGKDMFTLGIETPEDYINLGSAKQEAMFKMMGQTTGERTKEVPKNSSDQK